MRNSTLIIAFLLLNLTSLIAGNTPYHLTFDLCHNEDGVTKKMVYNSQTTLISELVTIETDMCSAAMTLASNGSVTDNGTNLGSGDEVGELAPPSLTSPINSVWYNITTTGMNTSVVINFTPGTIVGAVVSIWPNICLPTMPPLFEQVIAAAGPFTACLPAGMYKIQVATDATGTMGTYMINVLANTSASPTNENCAGASTEPVIAGINNVDNICSTDGMVWFQYTVTTGDHVDVTTLAAPWVIGNMFLNGCATPFNNTTCVKPGDIINIEAGNPAPAYGSFDINIVESDNTVVNDDCTDAASNIGILTCNNTLNGGGNINACSDTETTCAAGIGLPGVWYNFTVDPLVTSFDFTGTGFEVFTGACGSLVPFGCAGSAAVSNVDIDVSGNTYKVLVFSGGNFTAIADPQSPTNNTCGTAATLNNASAATGSTACATAPPTAFCSVTTTGDHAVWYTYTTPNITTSTNITFTYSGNGGLPASDIGIAVYDACGGTQLFTSCNSSGDVMQCVLPGTVLKIAVGSQDGSEGGFNLTATANAAGIPANDLCSQPTVITPVIDCTWSPVVGDNTNSCPESYNGGCSQNTDNTIWYSITLPANAIGVDIQAVTGGASIEIWNNNCANPATGPTGAQGCVTGDDFVPLAGGNTYLISVSSAGSFTFDIRTKVPPANDLCAMATTLNLGTSIPGTTECATFTGENAAGCDGSPENLVWYTHTVGTDVKTLTLAVSNFSTGTINVVAWDGCGSSTYYNDDNNNEACGTNVSLDIDCPISGTTILFAVSSTQTEEGTFDIILTESQIILPTNDDCANATLANGPICEVYQTTAGDNTTACPEGFDLGGCGFDVEEVVWYQIDLPADAKTIDIGINNYTGAGTPFFGVFSDCFGTSINGACLTNVSAGDPVAAGTNIDVTAQAGTSIFIGFGSQGDAGGSHQLDIKINNTPDNDDPCMPEIFSAGGGTVPGSTECATIDYTDPACTATYENTVWYEYTLGAGETGIEVEVLNNSATAPLGVAIVDFAGNCNAAPTIFPNASSCAGETEVVKAVCLPPGTIVHIVVGTSNANAGTFDITITPIIPVPACIDNDDCANAQDLGQLVTDAPCISVSDCNDNACPDVVGTCNGGVPVNNVVWYQVQNDGTGEFISVEVSNATFNAPVIGVFVGANCGSLTQVGGCTTGNGGAGATGPLDLPTDPPVVGENYYIAIGTNGLNGGNFDLCIEITGGCVNDDPCDAVSLTNGTTLTNPASTSNCTADEPNPNCPGSDLNTVWYKFIVPPGMSTIVLQINNISITGNYSIQLGEYVAGTPACSNQNPPIFDDCSNVASYLEKIYCVKENVEYYIQIGSATGIDAGDFEITVSGAPPAVQNDICSQANSNTANQIDIGPDDYCQYVPLTSSTVAACPDDVMSGACDYTMSETVWMLINIPNDPAITIMDVLLEDDTQGGGAFSIFENDCANLVPLAGGECGMTGTAIEGITVTPGASYLVAITTTNMTPGTFTFNVKVIAPPANDLCDNAIEIGLGGSEMGTTECATNSGTNNFGGCATNLNQSDVWYEIVITNDMDIITVDITGWSGTANYAAAAFYSSGGCALTPADVGGVLIEDCAGDKSLEIPVSCLDPAITSIYIKVGSRVDNGEAADGDEQGTFNINVSNTSPSCEYGDICDEAVEVTTSTPADCADGENILSTNGCLEFACPEVAPFNNCSHGAGPTVWFHINIDSEDATKLITQVDAPGFDAVWSIYQGTSCADLTPISEQLVVNGVTETYPCSDSDANIPNIFQTAIDPDPAISYWIAITAIGPVNDPNFTLNYGSSLGCLACSGSDSFDCGNGELEASVDGIVTPGPFCPGEEVEVCLEFIYNTTGSGNDWLHGFVPTFGNGWDLQATDLSSLDLGGSWEFADATGSCGAYLNGYDLPNVCTVFENGVLKLYNTACNPNAPCVGPLPDGSPLPSGWWWSSDGSSPTCGSDCSPSDNWGWPNATNVTVNVCFDLKVKVYQTEAECNLPGNKDLQISIQTFSDAISGCWVDSNPCRTDPSFTGPAWQVDCQVPTGVIFNPNPVEICTGETFNVNVSTEDGTNLEIVIEYIDNPNVTGMTNHTVFGNGDFGDELINTGTEVETVIYTGYVIDPNIMCPSPLDSLLVIVYPELEVNFNPFFICEGFCTNITPSTIIGGTGTYVGYEWSTGETGTDVINVCPTVSTTYIVTVTDDHGCTGTGEIEVEVKPKVDALFDPTEVAFCKDGIEDNDDLITVIIEDGSPNYFFDWSSSPFGLTGTSFGNFENYNGDSYQVDAELSFESFFGPYALCVEIVDMFGCADTACIDVIIQGSPDGSLAPTAPLTCGQTMVDLLATFNQGSSLSDIDRFELYDCDGNYIDIGSGSPTIFEDLDLENVDCFVLLTYNVVGCIDTDTLQLQITTGTEAILQGDTTICIGENASVNVSNEADFSNPTYLWSNGLNTPNIIVSPDSTTTYIVTVTDDANCTDAASFTVFVNNLPKINISGSYSFCTTSSTSLMATNGPGATYIWTNATNDTISITNSVTISVQGNYTLEVKRNGCLNDSTFLIQELTSLTPTLNEPILCDNGVDTLFAGNGFALYDWSYNSNPIGTDTSFLEISQAGEYAVTVTDATGCSGTDVVTIQNFPTPNATVTDTIEVCRQNNGVGSFTIDFNAQVTGAAGTWVDTDLSGVSLANLSSVSFEGITRDTYSFTYTTNTAMGSCSNVSVVMEVIVKSCPCPVVATKPIPNQCNTVGNIVNLNTYLTSPGVQVGNWSYVSGPTTLTINNNMVDLSGVMGGMYVLQWTISTPAGTCPTSSQQTLTVFETPFAGIVTGMKSLCNANTGQGATDVDLNTYLVSGSASGTWTQKSGPPIITLPMVSGLGLNDGDVLVFTYTTTSATTPCKDISVDVTIRIRDCNCPFATIDVLPPLCNSGTTIDLNDYLMTEPTGLAGTWSINATPNPISGSILNATGVPSGQYLVTYTLTDDPGVGCAKTFTQDVFVRRQPRATVIGSGSPCNTNASGTDITTVNLNSLLAPSPSAGTWMQTGGSVTLPIVGGIVDFDGQNIGDVFEFTYTTTSAVMPCTNISVPVTVTVVDCNCPNVDINPAGPLCNTDIDLDLSSLEGPNIDAGTWSVLDPNNVNVPITGKILTITDLQAGNYSLIYTLTTQPSGSCQGDSTQILVIEAQKSAAVNPRGEACSADNGNGENLLDLFTLVTAGAIDGKWYDSNGVEVPNPYAADFQAFNPGDMVMMTYVLTSNIPCADVTYPVVIEVLDCLCPTIVVSDFEACSADGIVTLAPFGDPGKPGSFQSSEVTITNGTVDISTLNGNFIIDYVINSPEPGCPDRKPLTMTVIKAYNPGIASTTSLCVSDAEVIDLFSLLENEDIGGVWKETSTQGSSGAAFSATNGTFNTNGQAVGSYRFTYSFLNNTPCPDVSSEVTVVVQNIPPVDAGEAQTLDCTLLEALLGGTAQNANFTYKWTHDGGKTVLNETNAQTKTSFPGVFTLTVTDNITGCTSSDQVTIDLSNAKPSADVSSKNVTCFGEGDGSVNVINVIGGATPYQYSSNGGVTFQNSANFLNLDPGDYQMVIKDAAGCVIPLEDITITEPAQFLVDLGPDVVLKFETLVTLDITGQFDPNRATSILWTITTDNGDSIICNNLTDCFTYEHLANKNATICVTITDANDCIATDCINLNVIRIRDITLPQIFTPKNNDGVNDIFFVNDNDVERVERFFIFDRWGNKVFSMEDTPPNDPQYGWNGTFNGKNVVPGVYVYVIEVLYAGGLNERETFSADITVVK